MTWRQFIALLQTIPADHLDDLAQMVSSDPELMTFAEPIRVCMFKDANQLDHWKQVDLDRNGLTPESYVLTD